MGILHARNFFGRGEDFSRTTYHLQPFLVGADTIETDVLVVVKLLFDGDGDGDGVANRNRAGKMQLLVNQRGAGAGELGAKYRRNQRTTPHAVGDDFAEHAAFRVIVVE